MLQLAVNGKYYRTPSKHTVQEELLDRRKERNKFKRYFAPGEVSATVDGGAACDFMAEVLASTSAEAFNLDAGGLENLIAVRSQLDLSRLESVLTAVVKELKRANLRISSLEKDVQEERTKGQSVREDAEQLQNTLTATIAELRAQTAKTQQTENNLQVLTEQYSKLNEKCDAMEGKLEARITNCEGRIREIKAAKEEADEASKREGATLGARVAMVERSLASKAREDVVQDLAGKLEDVNKRVAHMEDLPEKVDLLAFDEFDRSTRSEIASLREMVQVQRTEITEDITSLDQKIDELKFGEEQNGGAAVMEMMSELEGVRAEINAMTSRNNNLRNEISSRVQAVEKELPELDVKLSTQISDLRQVLDAIGQNDSSHAVQSAGVDSIALKKMKAELESSMATREELQRFTEPIHERVERAEGDMREIRRGLTDAKRTISELRAITDTKLLHKRIDDITGEIEKIEKRMVVFASQEDLEQKMTRVKDDLAQKLEIGWAIDFEQTSKAQDRRLQQLEDSLPKLKDKMKSKADKGDITRVKKMIGDIELQMENVGAGSKVKCISCDKALDKPSEPKVSHIDGFITSGKSALRDNYFGKMHRHAGGEHTADRVIIAPLNSFPHANVSEDNSARPYTSPRIPFRLPPPPSGNTSGGNFSPRSKKLVREASAPHEVNQFEKPTMDPFPTRKTPRKNTNNHYSELEARLETTTLAPSEWEE